MRIVANDMIAPSDHVRGHFYPLVVRRSAHTRHTTRGSLNPGASSAEQAASVKRGNLRRRFETQRPHAFREPAPTGARSNATRAAELRRRHRNVASRLVTK